MIDQSELLDECFVYVKGDTLKGYRFEIPDSPVVLQQRNCRFEPHVFGLRVGQPLQIINADPTVHNVHPTPKLNQEWNYSHAPDGPPMVKNFARAEVLIPIKDNQHPWERAFVAVMDHPSLRSATNQENLKSAACRQELISWWSGTKVWRAGDRGNSRSRRNSQR